MNVPFRAVTFDCFGTLIDWKLGQTRILEQFPSLRGRQDSIPDILAVREPVEMRLEAGAWRSYASILSDSIAEAVRQVLHLELTPAEQRAFAAGQLGWPAFPDTAEALRTLARHVPVGLLSNCDAQTLRLCAHKHLGAPISLFVSAEEVQSYKPAPSHWGAALAALHCKPSEILHCSFTRAYDLDPAHALGFALGFIGRYRTPKPADLPFAAEGRDLAALVHALVG
ncbi:MAG: hypothetical protein EYC70_11370 [Planctomycetota bacterium]|nr:MAG: hypothetical protein EYC70_11370 [Planctomycetota bacterium]